MKPPPAPLPVLAVLGLWVVTSLAAASLAPAPAAADTFPRTGAVRSVKPGPKLPRDKKVDRWLAGAGISRQADERYAWALVVLALDRRGEDPEGAGCIWRSVRLHDAEVGAVDPAALPVDEKERRFLVEQLEADLYPLGEKPPIESDYDAPLPPIEEEVETSQPKRTKAFYPAYTPAAAEARTRGQLVLTGIVGTDGRYRVLRVVEPRAHGLVHTAIAAVCSWEFEPAKRNRKEPMAVRYDALLEMEPPSSLRNF